MRNPFSRKRFPTLSVRSVVFGTVLGFLVYSQFFSRDTSFRISPHNVVESITISGLDKSEDVAPGTSSNVRAPVMADSSRTKDAPSQLGQNAEIQHLELSNSAFSLYSSTGFASFFTCAANRSLGECPETRVQAIRWRSTRVIFQTLRKGCSTDNFVSMVRHTISSHVKDGVLYTTPYLRHSIVDFMDPPIPLIGTSAKYSRKVTAGEISEFATHIAIWREIFSMRGKKNALVLTSYLPSNKTLRHLSSGLLERLNEALTGMGDHWDMILLHKFLPNRLAKSFAWVNPVRLPGVANYSTAEPVDPTTYVLSASGANILLASAPAYVQSLPNFLQAVARQKKEDGTPLFRMLHFFENPNVTTREHVGLEDDLSNISECRLPLRQVGKVMWSHELPFYPPHHELLDVPGEEWATVDL